MNIDELISQRDLPRNMADVPLPIFILCPERSYSSVVCAMLGQHPQLFGLPELNLFLADTVGDLLDMSTPPFGRRHLRGGILRTLAHLCEEQQSEASIEEALGWLRNRKQWTCTDLYRFVQALVTPLRCVDKSPTNSRADGLQRILQAFPDAHFLHLARHPRATCRSRHKIRSERRPKRADQQNHESYWTGQHTLILEFSKQLEPWQYIYIKGEDLLEKPDQYLVQIANWLGVSSDGDAISAMTHPERSPFAQPGPENALGGNNAGFMKDPKLRVGKVPEENLEGPLEWRQDSKGFEPRSIALARQLGYA